MAGLQSHTQFPEDYGRAMMLNDILAKDPQTNAVLVFADDEVPAEGEKIWFSVYAPHPQYPEYDYRVFSFHAEEKDALRIANQRYPQRYQKFLQKYALQTSPVSLSA